MNDWGLIRTGGLFQNLWLHGGLFEYGGLIGTGGLNEDLRYCFVYDGKSANLFGMIVMFFMVLTFNEVDCV